MFNFLPLRYKTDRLIIAQKNELLQYSKHSHVECSDFRLPITLQFSLPFQR
jgi:hypothetical protein